MTSINSNSFVFTSNYLSKMIIIIISSSISSIQKQKIYIKYIHHQYSNMTKYINVLFNIS